MYLTQELGNGSDHLHVISRQIKCIETGVVDASVSTNINRGKSQMENSAEEIQDHFSVSFRIMKAGLEPSKLTTLLGMEPDKSHKKDDPRISKTKSGKVLYHAPFNSGLWCLESKLDKSSKLQEHILDITDRIESKRDLLIKLKDEGFEMDLYCGYFLLGESQPGISLSNSVLKKISELGMDLGIQLYVLYE